MRRNSLCMMAFSIVILASTTGLADTKPTGSFDVANNADNSRTSEGAQEVACEEDSAVGIQDKKPAPLNEIASSILKSPGYIIDGVTNIPLDGVVSSTLQIPEDTVKFVAEIPYDKIAWTSLEVTAGIIEFLADDGFLIGFIVGYNCHH